MTNNTLQPHLCAGTACKGRGKLINVENRNRETTFAEATYIGLRPTFEAGDSTAPASVDDYEECQIQIGPYNHPPFALEFHDTFAGAIESALNHRKHHPHLRLFYNGLEVQKEFSDWASLADVLEEYHDDWEVVAQFASGQLPPDAPEVTEVLESAGLSGAKEAIEALLQIRKASPQDEAV